MENILGKCWILGLTKDMTAFNNAMEFILRYLNAHIQTSPPVEPGFAKIYHFRDYEKVLACFLPFLGYHGDPAVLRIARKRLDALYAFTRWKRYDIYVDGSKLKGVKKEWQPYIIDPDLYADGHIVLPDMHDMLMFAGMYPFLVAEDKEKAENVVEWLFGEGYKDIIGRYGYFYAPGGSYNAKAVIFKLRLVDFDEKAFSNNDLSSLVFNAFILSHFKTARESAWLATALQYLGRYKNVRGCYNFPPGLISEKPDSYVIFGGHMNVGENKKAKSYNEIISTYWMERIQQNMNIAERVSGN
jgi:hypothetical protein